MFWNTKIVTLVSMADYGPRGFTTLPPIADLLEPYVEGELGDVRLWAGLGAVDARLLLERLPEDVRVVQHQAAPSLSDAVDAIERHGGTLSGYWVLPPRQDERITVDGMIVPAQAAEEIDPEDTAEEREELPGGMVRLWWD
jgi:hypothetical protein